jgi:hypothetical protein
MPEPEERTEEAIQVRQVTNVHPNWNEEQRGEPGKFSFDLILDNGAEEYVIRPMVQDSKMIAKLLRRAKSHYFDLERKVLISRNIPLGGS